MNPRAALTENPLRALAVAGGMILVGLTVMGFQMRGRPTPTRTAREFFTTDDGKTWFADDAAKIPPFDKDGSQAVRAYVYRCPDGTKFVNHLERFKPAAKRVLEEADKPDPNRTGPPKNLVAIQSAFTGGREVKRPGDAKWIASGDFRAAAEVAAVKCPNGGTDAVPVEP